MKIKNSKGITLIALVITIIVLLILAGISIAMLTGDNGLLTKASTAKEETEMAQIKEQAELIKADLIADNVVNGVETKNTDVAKAINDDTTYFPGSKLNGNNKVVTADEKYDIVVDRNLEITVIKHVPTVPENSKLSFEEIPTESRAVMLKVTIEGAPTVEEWLKTLSPEELKQTFAEGFIGEGATWNQVCERLGKTYTDVDDLFGKEEGLAGRYSDKYEFMIDNGLYVDGRSLVSLTCSNGESIEVAGSGEFGITTNGEYTVTATTEEGETVTSVANVTKCKIEKYSAIQETNTTLKIDNYDVTIPAGFAYGISENVGHVNTGLVITDKVDSEGNSIGNEFVWVPVETVISDEANATTNKAMAENKGTDENPQYRGLLYNFDGTSSTVQSGCTKTTSDFREPANLSDTTDGDQANSSKINGWTETLYQEEYNKMIKSVKDNKGFYVSRYEMGVEDGKAISKLAVTPTSAYDSETREWYGLYNKAKTYENNKNSITSSMIWGSQYDAMLNFALKGSDKNKVTATVNGNHSGKLIKTGLTKTQDSINNIYDLEGNMFEWTQEADGTNIRVGRRRRFRR